MDRPPFTIVLAVDFSRASATALRVTADLAARTGARVVLTHALAHNLAEPADVREAHPDVPAGRAASIDEAQGWAESLRAEGVETEVDARAGDAHDVILTAVLHHRADLVVLGRRGLGRTQRLLMGSVTKAVLADCKVPVTVVPEV